jgi:hypothetical protein
VNKPAWIAVLVIATMVLGSAYLAFFVINP